MTQELPLEDRGRVVELRDIEIFLTLAEELHFGRTADRLHVSQARVSQSIAKQERKIGAPLFARNSRKVELTAIGAQLRRDLGAGYHRILDGTRAATAAARGATGTLTLGLHGSQAHDHIHLLDLFRSRTPRSPSAFRRSSSRTPSARSGTVRWTWRPPGCPSVNRTSPSDPSL